MVHLDVLDSGISSTTQVVENKDKYLSPKTSFKTNTKNDDDEAFAGFAKIVQDASRDITCRSLSAADREALAELAGLLATELRIAAARTSNVSSVAAFLTEHLRRRLWKLDKRQASEEGRREASAGGKPRVSGAEARSCPDCGGSGMYYPEGYDKGVAKCRHERLKVEETSKPPP